MILSFVYILIDSRNNRKCLSNSGLYLPSVKTQIGYGRNNWQGVDFWNRGSEYGVLLATYRISFLRQNFP